MSYQSEAQLEELLIKDLIKKDYERIEIRDSESLEINFRKVLFQLNKDKLGDKPFTDKEFEKIMLHIGGKSIYHSAKILRDQFVLRRDDGSEIYLDFLSAELGKNIFQVTNQTTVLGKYTNRYDVTLLVNGLPLVQIELKRRGMELKAAYNQIMRYRRHSYTGLYRFIQLFVISNGVDTKYFANNDGEIPYSQTFFWTDEENNRITVLQDFSDAFLSKSFLTKMLSRYFIINDTDKLLMVMRPYQIFATEALVKRALETHKDGYIWHTTGAGKTLTSFKAAQLIAQDSQIEKVFFLVDRKDLDMQTIQEFNKFEEGSVDMTESTHVLVSQIKNPKKKLIITTIQKMANAVKNERYEETMGVLKDKRIILVTDECHRTQFGQMHTIIKKHFQKAQFFGFTGTPRFSENRSIDGRTTADVFGDCLHTYLIKEAIHDNNVLGFNVEYIQTFQGQYDEKDETKVSAIDEKEVFESPERIEMVANHIVNHHNLKTRNRQYTALFTVASVPLLIKYYDAFKKIDHDLRITGIFTYNPNEEAEGKDEHSRDSLERIISDYNQEFHTNYTTDTFASYSADISKRVKTKQIDILLVVDMFTSGFDSKPLSTLYADKNLKFHNLLQAFSRTNRVELATKPYGNIVCYRNLKQNTDEAIKLFSQTDSVNDILLKDYEFYLESFRDKAAELYKIAENPEDVGKLLLEEDQKKFIETFRDLSKILLILQSFVEFEFREDLLSIEEQTYQDFRSKYLDLYDHLVRTGGTGEKASILDDIDFSIELMHTDRINLSYIIHLIKSLDLKDEEKTRKDIEHIKKELDRTDNPQLRKKVELIKEFLNEVVPKINSGDSVDDEFYGFENHKKNQDIEEFCQSNQVEKHLIVRELSEYEFTGVFRKDRARESITEKLPFLKKKALVEKIQEFMKNLMDKYQ